MQIQIDTSYLQAISLNKTVKYYTNCKKNLHLNDKFRVKHPNYAKSQITPSQAPRKRQRSNNEGAINPNSEDLELV